MQIKKLVVGVAAAGLLGIVPVGSAASASTVAPAGSGAAAETPRASKSERTFKVRIKNSRKRILAGKIKPKPRKRLKVIVQRAKKPNGKFKKSRTFRTKKNGKFQAQFPRGTYYFRLVVKGNKKYKKAISGTYRVGFI